MNYINNVKTYFKSIGAVAIMTLLLPMLFATMALDTVSSFIASSVCFFIISIISAKLILGNSFIKPVAVAYLVLLSLSTIHYLYFVDSNYFAGTGAGSSNFYHEYLTAIDGVQRLVDWKETNGIFSIITSDSWQLPHVELWSLISIPFIYLKVLWLNFAPFNIFCSIMIALNVYLTYLNTYSYDEGSGRILWNWLLYFPLFILGDIIWRDAAGMALCSVGLVCVKLSKNFISLGVSLVSACILCYLQRTLYPALLIGSFAIALLCESKSSGKKILGIVASIAIMFAFSSFFNSTTEDSYHDTYINSSSFIMLPIKIVFGLIGPFPWSGFLTYKINPAFSYELPQYILGTFQFGYLISIVLLFKQFSFKSLDLLTLFGFCLMMSGFVTSQMHISYIAEGLIFTLPWYFGQIGTLYRKYFRISLLILVGLNILILATGHLGLGSLLWK